MITWRDSYRTAKCHSFIYLSEYILSNSIHTQHFESKSKNSKRANYNTTITVTCLYSKRKDNCLLYQHTNNWNKYKYNIFYKLSSHKEMVQKKRNYRVSSICVEANAMGGRRDWLKTIEKTLKVKSPPFCNSLKIILAEQIRHITGSYGSWSINLTFLKTLANLEPVELVTGTEWNQYKFINKL